MSIKIDYQTAIELLTSQVDAGMELLHVLPISETDYSRWAIVTKNHLRKIFGEDSQEESDVFGYRIARVFRTNADRSWLEAQSKKELSDEVNRLKAQIDALNKYASLSAKANTEASNPIGRRVFLVHGHNMEALHTVARFLEGIGLEVTVLQEEPNRGQTIIEKFEQHGDVGFAVVLLTGDDTGRAAGASKLRSRPRARQNVIFELGYFIGRLGRERVCALYEDGVELPSDYSGVLYISIDTSGGWKLKLGKELDAAGFEIDLNKVR